jgi:hypothetical protein
MSRAALAAVIATLLAAAGAPTAFAHWTAAGSGDAAADAATLAPAAISVPSEATGAVTVDWNQQATLVPGSPSNEAITYRVDRRAGDGAYAAVASGDCAGPLPRGTTSCSDRPPADGIYRYRVVAVFNSWTATSSEAGPVTVTLDSTAPTVASILRSDPDPTAASSATWTVTFSEAVTGVDAGDFALARSGGLTGGAVTGVSGSGTTRTVTATTGSGSGTLGLNLVDDDSVRDAAGNPLGGAGAGNGSAAGQAYTVDRSPPALTSLQMLDTNANGKINRVTATFNEPIAASTATAPWTLSAVPSGGSLASVSTSGSTATLSITEGTGAADTAVGAFRVALAASAAGVRDPLGNQASFAAAAPLDRAGPVPVNLTDVSGTTDGLLQQNDALSVVFSEPIASALPASTTITETRPATGNATLTIASFTAGARNLGSANYLTAPGSVSVPGTITRSADSKTITVTAGVCTTNCALLAAGTGTTMSYAPLSALQDAAGNNATGARAAGRRIF